MSRLHGSADVRRNVHQSLVVEDEVEKEDGAVRVELLPQGDGAEDGDEDGDRFFGGGITRDTEQAIDYVDQQDDSTAERIDRIWLRKKALAFERSISKNAEQRGKYEDQPRRFMESETELDAAVKEISTLSDHPELYLDFIGLGSVSSLVGLLAHENVDIVTDVLQVIEELTNEDVEASESQLTPLIDALFETDLASLLQQNLERLDEAHEPERNGVHHGLNIIENLGSHPGYIERILVGNQILPWILKRAARQETPVSQNKQYAAELLTVLAQSSRVNRQKLLDLDGVEIHLQLLSNYRRHNPQSGTAEEEFMENLFDTLVCLVDEDNGKSQLVASEGIELCLMMLREGDASKTRALRVLDHAMGGGRTGTSASMVATKLVEAAGIRTIFGILMKRSRQDAGAIEHILGIVASLFQMLPIESPERLRLLAKFVEKDYEKIARLIEIRLHYVGRLQDVERRIQTEKAELGRSVSDSIESGWLSRKLDAGLFMQQTADVILAWLVAEDVGAKSRIILALKQQGESLTSIRSTLQEQLESLDGDRASGDETTRAMLAALSEALVI